MASIALTGQVGAEVAHRADEITVQPRVEDWPMRVKNCKHHAAPIRSSRVSSTAAIRGVRAFATLIKPSLRVNRPARKRLRCAWQSHNGNNGERYDFRHRQQACQTDFAPTRSAMISATRPTIRQEPTMLAAWVTALSGRRRQAGRWPALTQVLRSLYPNRAAVWLLSRALSPYRPITFRCLNAFCRPVLRPRFWRHCPCPQPKLCASHRRHP